MKRSGQFGFGSSLGKATLLGLGFILLAGCGGGQSSSDNGTTTTAPTTPTMTPPTMPMGMGKGGPGGVMPGGMPGSSMPGGGALAGGQQPAAAGGAGKKQVAAAITGKYHQDPFLITWKKKPLPPDVFAEVQPLQVADTTVQAPPEKPVVVEQVPDRRVAGIMRGNGVYAILEQNGQSEKVTLFSWKTSNYRTCKPRRKRWAPAPTLDTAVIQERLVEWDGPASHARVLLPSAVGAGIRPVVQTKNIC